MWKQVLKRIFAVIFFLVSLCALYGVAVAAVSMFKEIERLSNDKSASGMDFLLFEPMFIAFFSFIGLICSGVSTKLCSYKVIKIISFVLLILFCIIMFIGFSMWFIKA